MQTTASILALKLLATACAGASTYLNTIPGPDDTGGMVMPLVSLDINAKTISVNMSQGNTVSMYPLQQYSVWDGQPYANSVFDPTLANEPWYDLLDPTRQHLPFSTQFGFMLVSANASALPVGSYVYIKALSLSDGLKLFDIGYWEDVWQQQGGQGGTTTWMQVFGEGNFGSTLSEDLDNVAVWGDRSGIRMWHPVALVPDSGLTYSAQFQIYLGDGNGTPIEGWSTGNLTLNWIAPAVPEPALAAAGLAAAAGILGIARARRNRRRNAASAAAPANTNA